MSLTFSHGDGVTFWLHEIVLAQGECQKGRLQRFTEKKIVYEGNSSSANWEGTTLDVISTEWM